MTTWLICGTLVYVAVGVLVTAMLSQTPYADNPWWLTTLLWPVFIVGMLL
jgi:hypothetical protein